MTRRSFLQVSAGGGITLREFFGDKDYELILRKKLVQNEPYHVRAVMQDPFSDSARARATHK